MNPLNKAVLRQCMAVHKVVLRSRARGRGGMPIPISDMDVAVILEDKPDQATRDLVSECAWEAGFAVVPYCRKGDVGIVVVPVVFSRHEWENGPERSSLLGQAVDAEGVVV